MVCPRKSITAIWPLVTLFALSLMGCSSLRQPAQPAASDSGLTTITDPMVVVELHDGKDKTEYLRAPIKDSMLVQDALKGSGAIHRFRRMDVVLVRNVPGGGKLRLPVEYNGNTQRVADQHNYALHGGDTLEVTEDTSTAIDRMIEQALEPLRPMIRSYDD